MYVCMYVRHLLQVSLALLAETIADRRRRRNPERVLQNIYLRAFKIYDSI